MSWIKHTEVDWDDFNINQYHVDTRDFHVSRVESPTQEFKLSHTVTNKPSSYFMTGEEVKALIERYFTESGGDGKWRIFMLDTKFKGAQGWSMKYIRIYRFEQGLIVVNSECNNHSPIPKDVLKSKVNSRNILKTIKPLDI